MERQVSLGNSWLRKLRVVGTPSCHLKEESTCNSQCRSSCRLMEWSVYKTSCNPEMGATATYLEASRRQEAAANWNWDFLIVVVERKVSRQWTAKRNTSTPASWSSHTSNIQSVTIFLMCG